MREEALHQPQTEIEQEVKQEIADIFRELLDRLWERLASLVGDVATAAIVQSARREVAREHPFLDKLEVGETGVRLDRLRLDLATLDRATIRAGMLALMNNIIDILTALTGDVLVRKVQPLVREFREQIEED